MKVIFALGNPGEKYANSRHNTGWRMIDDFATNHQLTFTSSSKFFANVADGIFDDEKFLIVKPTTFYNDVGQSARKIADFYKLNPEDFLIIHDDLALPLGTLRTRWGGSSAGNNGIKSLTQHLGENTARLRIGVSSDRTSQDNVSNVLGNFNRPESEQLTELQSEVRHIIESFIAGSFQPTTTR